MERINPSSFLRITSIDYIYINKTISHRPGVTDPHMYIASEIVRALNFNTINANPDTDCKYFINTDKGTIIEYGYDDVKTKLPENNYYFIFEIIKTTNKISYSIFVKLYYSDSRIINVKNLFDDFNNPFVQDAVVNNHQKYIHALVTFFHLSNHSYYDYNITNHFEFFAEAVVKNPLVYSNITGLFLYKSNDLIKANLNPISNKLDNSIIKNIPVSEIEWCLYLSIEFQTLEFENICKELKNYMVNINDDCKKLVIRYYNGRKIRYFTYTDEVIDIIFRNGSRLFNNKIMFKNSNLYIKTN